MNKFKSPPIGPACKRLLRRLVSVGVLVMLGISIESLSAATGDVQALFSLAEPAIGSFPSDQFIVPDMNQLTGRRVALQKPDCARQPSGCDEIDILNTLDGFSMRPRIGIAFGIGPTTRAK